MWVITNHHLFKTESHRPIKTKPSLYSELRKFDSDLDAGSAFVAGNVALVIIAGITTYTVA